MNIPLLKNVGESIERVIRAVPLGFWQRATHFDQWDEEECFIGQLGRYLGVASAEPMAERLGVSVGDIVVVYQIFPQMMSSLWGDAQPYEQLKEAMAKHGLILTWQDEFEEEEEDGDEEDEA